MANPGQFGFLRKCFRQIGIIVHSHECPLSSAQRLFPSSRAMPQSRRRVRQPGFIHLPGFGGDRCRQRLDVIRTAARVRDLIEVGFLAQNAQHAIRQVNRESRGFHNQVIAAAKDGAHRFRRAAHKDLLKDRTDSCSPMRCATR